MPISPPHRTAQLVQRPSVRSTVPLPKGLSGHVPPIGLPRVLLAVALAAALASAPAHAATTNQASAAPSAAPAATSHDANAIEGAATVPINDPP